MNGDPAAPSIAAILAFGGTNFDAKAAYKSLLLAATVPTAHDLSREGCPVECVGQRPSLDLWLKLHYIPVGANAWGPAADTLEDATADLAISELARRMDDDGPRRQFLERAQYWTNIFNPHATAEGGYIQNRNPDGTWPKFDPASTEGFVEGSAAQYLWMVPFNASGLFTMLGGKEKASQRLNAFFYNPDGSLAVTQSGGLHAELNNEPSIETPWLFNFLGQPWKTQELYGASSTIWTNSPTACRAMTISVRCLRGTSGPPWACTRRSPAAQSSSSAAPSSRPSTSAAPQGTSSSTHTAPTPTHPTPKASSWMASPPPRPGCRKSSSKRRNARVPAQHNSQQKVGNQRRGCAPVVRTMRPEFAIGCICDPADKCHEKPRSVQSLIA